MANVLFHPKGGWAISYRLPGSRKSITEYFGRTADGKSRAEVRLAEIALMRAKGEKLTRNSDLIYFDELVQFYLQDAKSRGVSDRGGKELTHMLNTKVTPLICHRPVDQLEYVDMLRLTRADGPWHNLAASTISRYMGSIKTIFSFGVDKRLTKVNPLEGWHKPQERKKDVHLTVADLRRIIAAAVPHLAWALEVEWNLGTRPGRTELFALRWADVDFDGLSVHVRGSKTDGANRIVPITNDFRARLLIMRQSATCEYIVSYQGKPITGSMRKSLAAACHRAGIVYPVCLYDVRHLFATSLLQGGSDLAAVSALLGHATIATTQKHYYHLMRGEKERAIATLPTIADPKEAKLVRIK